MIKVQNNIMTNLTKMSIQNVIVCGCYLRYHVNTFNNSPKPQKFGGNHKNIIINLLDLINLKLTPSNT